MQSEISNESSASDVPGSKRHECVSIVFLQMGGPSDLSQVRPFLKALFSDPMIIQLPVVLKPIQPFLASLIATIRTKGTKEMYTQIGGGSPILEITSKLGKNVEAVLRERKHKVNIAVSMRYSSPRADHAVEQIRKNKSSKIILFPLYPHYSEATTGSSIEDIEKHLSTEEKAKTIIVHDWSTAPFYVDWWVSKIAEKARTLASTELKKTHILFSAHGLPIKYVKNGDPYREKVELATKTIIKELESRGINLSYTLSFQSKVGPVEWLKPYTDEVIENLAVEGMETILVVPLGFVSDHVETLFEIDHLYRELAESVGIKRFERIPVPNADASFAKGLADYIEELMRDA